MTSVRLPELSYRQSPDNPKSVWDTLRLYLQKLIGSVEHELETMYDTFNTEINPVTASQMSVTSSSQSGQRSVILADTTTGAITITLPEPSEAFRCIYIIKKTSTDANALTVSTLAGASFDGAANYTTSATNRPSVTVVSDGTQYWII